MQYDDRRFLKVVLNLHPIKDKKNQCKRCVMSKTNFTHLEYSTGTITPCALILIPSRQLLPRLPYVCYPMIDSYCYDEATRRNDDYFPPLPRFPL